MSAFGKTRLQIINEVLPRMREATVATSSSTTYAALVASVLNVVKTQIEQAWRWRNLRDTYSVTAVPGTTGYVLTSTGSRAQIIDIWNVTTNRKLCLASTARFNEHFFGASTVQRGDVSEYNPVGLDSNYDLQIDVWPDPTRSNSLRANVYKPQPAPADSDVIQVPNQVLIEGIIAYLMAERGDDNGVSAQAQQDLYKDLLGGAIAAEGGQDPSETDFYVV